MQFAKDKMSSYVNNFFNLSHKFLACNFAKQNNQSFKYGIVKDSPTCTANPGHMIFYQKLTIF